MSLYSIIPADFAYDQRIGDKHRRVMLGLGVHSTQKHWIKLSQTKLAEQLSIARETVNRAIADLVEWGYLEKRTQKDTQRAICFYRIIMSRDEPDINSEELDVEGCDAPITSETCDAPITGTCDGTDHTGVTPGDHTGVTLAVTQDVLPKRSKKSFSAGARASDAKAPPALPAQAAEHPRLVIAGDSEWWKWLAHVERITTVHRRRDFENAGRMLVFSERPSFTGRQPDAAPATGSARHGELMAEREQRTAQPGPIDRKMAAAGDAA